MLWFAGETHQFLCQPQQQVEEVVLVAKEPGSPRGQGGRGPDATLQVTNHVLGQQNTCELSRREKEEK